MRSAQAGGDSAKHRCGSFEDVTGVDDRDALAANDGDACALDRGSGAAHGVEAQLTASDGLFGLREHAQDVADELLGAGLVARQLVGALGFQLVAAKWALAAVGLAAQERGGESKGVLLATLLTQIGGCDGQVAVLGR